MTHVLITWRIMQFELHAVAEQLIENIDPNNKQITALILKILSADSNFTKIEKERTLSYYQQLPDVGT